MMKIRYYTHERVCILRNTTSPNTVLIKDLDSLDLNQWPIGS